MADGRNPRPGAATQSRVQHAMFIGAALLAALAVYAVLDFTMRGDATSRHESLVAPYQAGFAGR